MPILVLPLKKCEMEEDGVKYLPRRGTKPFRNDAVRVAPQISIKKYFTASRSASRS